MKGMMGMRQYDRARSLRPANDAGDLPVSLGKTFSRSGAQPMLAHAGTHACSSWIPPNFVE